MEEKNIETIVLVDGKNNKRIAGKDEVRFVSSFGTKHFLINNTDLYSMGKDNEYHLLSKGYETKYRVPK